MHIPIVQYVLKKRLQHPLLPNSSSQICNAIYQVQLLVPILESRLPLRTEKTNQDQIEATAEKTKAIKIVYTSALTGENCEEALKTLVEMCVKNA